MLSPCVPIVDDSGCPRWRCRFCFCFPFRVHCMAYYGGRPFAGNNALHLIHEGRGWPRDHSASRKLHPTLFVLSPWDGWASGDRLRSGETRGQRGDKESGRRRRRRGWLRLDGSEGSCEYRGGSSGRNLCNSSFCKGLWISQPQSLARASMFLSRTLNSHASSSSRQSR